MEVFLIGGSCFYKQSAEGEYWTGQQHPSALRCVC